MSTTRPLPLSERARLFERVFRDHLLPLLTQPSPKPTPSAPSEDTRNDDDA